MFSQKGYLVLVSRLKHHTVQHLHKNTSFQQQAALNSIQLKNLSNVVFSPWEENKALNKIPNLSTSHPTNPPRHFFWGNGITQTSLNSNPSRDLEPSLTLTFSNFTKKESFMEAATASEKPPDISTYTSG